MTLYKLTVMNLKQNLKNYRMYIFSMVFSIMVFYNFLTLSVSEQFRNLTANSDIISALAIVCLNVLLFFFLFFVSYSSRFFVEQRKKEFGVYTFIGLDNKSLAVLFAFEGLLVGVISLIVGLVGGILCNKLFLMAIVKMSDIRAVMEFEVNVIGISITSIVFGVILLVVSIREYIILVRTDVVKLIQASKSYQNETQKNKTIIGFIGFLILGFAYYFVIFYEQFTYNFMIVINVTVTLVIIGTILLFKGFFSFFLAKRVRNKRFLYKKTNVVSYNNMVFRIRDNNKTLSAVAILITCCLTSVITSTSMKEFFNRSFDLEAPYSVSYLNTSPEIDQVMNEAIEGSGEKVKYRLDVKLIEDKVETNFYPMDTFVVSYSELEKIASKVSLYQEGKIPDEMPKKGTGFIISQPNIIGMKVSGDVNVGQKQVTVTDTFASVLFTRHLVNGLMLVVNDEDFLELEQKAPADTEMTYTGVTLENFKQTTAITSFAEKKNSRIEMFNADHFDESEYSFVNTIYFLGFFLGLVFLLSIGSMMYFKCIADATKDRERFSILRKIGTGEGFIRKTVYKQVGIFFLIPIVVGIIHSIVAANAINGFLNMTANWLNVIAVLIFCALYLGYYFLTVKKYLQVTR